MKVRLIVAGRSYHHAGAIPDQLTLPEGSSVDHALEEVGRHMQAGQTLPDSCLVAVSGTHLGTVRQHRPRVASRRRRVGVDRAGCRRVTWNRRLGETGVLMGIASGEFRATMD